MKHVWLAALTASMFYASSVFLSAADPDPGVTLIGTGAIPGSSLDLSGLQGQSICALDVDKNPTTNCIDRATLGGFGSALAYTGHNDVFLAVPDRGPFDGRTDIPYLDRFHFLHITVDTRASFPPATSQSNIRVALLDTRFLKSTGNEGFVGDAGNNILD